MFVAHFLFALGTAVILSLIFALGFGKKGVRPSALMFFIIILLASWAGGIWMTPIGPPIGELYWLPFLITGLVIALVLVAVVPRRTRRSTVESKEPSKETTDGRAAYYWTFGMFFWFLVFALIVAIVWRYL